MGRRPGSGGPAALRDRFRNELWPLPTIGVVLALILGILLPYVDEHLGSTLPPGLRNLLFGGGAGAATTVLDSIASSTITVTSLTFSLTVVTLQLASSQFSPRLLRTFTSDLFVQLTLTLFLSTFTYALTVLRTVRTEDGTQTEFVPQLSVTVAFVLVIASVIGLVLFLAHLAQVIRVETMLRTVRGDASATLRRTLDEAGDGQTSDDGTEGGHAPVPPDGAFVLLAPSSGFLASIDQERMLATARDLDVTVLLDRWVGSSVVAGTPVGVAWRATDSLGDDDRERIDDLITEALQVGPERTGTQDIGFGLRQLTDVAIKALSPGINDPTTAVYALGHSAALLCEFAGRRLGPDRLTDDNGRVRVVLARQELPDLLELAVAQPRRYGAADPDVLARIAVLLAELAWCVQRPDDRRTVTRQLDRWLATVRAADFDDTENERLIAMAEAVRRALRRDWTPEMCNA